MQNLIGHYLWDQHRDNYLFHVEPSYVDGVVTHCAPFGPEVACPAFRVATHFSTQKATTALTSPINLPK